MTAISCMDTLPPVTLGTLLNGRVRYRQFCDGYRTGLEPVLMAACVPARAGQYVLEGGCGAGAGLLCLATRVRGVCGIGLECDSPTVLLGRMNVEDNGFDAIRILQATLPVIPDDSRLSGPGVRRIDHAFANPPWHDHASTPSPVPRRDRARRLPRAGLAQWVGSLSAQLRHHGTLTLAVPATLLDHAISSMGENRLGDVTVFPCWPRQGVAAKIVLIRGRMGSRTPARLLPGIVLHHADGTFTPEACAVLRDGQPLLD
ncbi:methyltransferase [Komagataeibacter sp. FXV2]|nr:methyltransferase [Komagataeibacter sp. FXV2]